MIGTVQAEAGLHAVLHSNSHTSLESVSSLGVERLIVIVAAAGVQQAAGLSFVFVFEKEKCRKPILCD